MGMGRKTIQRTPHGRIILIKKFDENNMNAEEEEELVIVPFSEFLPLV